ncbi:MAG: fructosamine kinase family protein [Pseudanabaenaceae cyanobacterium]
MAVASSLWAQIAINITEAIGEQFLDYTYQPVGGGCINQTYCLTNNRYRFFVKINTADRLEMMRAEYLALHELRNTNTIAVPTPICLGASAQHTFLVLEWLELKNSRRDQDWQLLGKQLAQLHRVTSRYGFGWHMHNTIGVTPQINTWEKDWQTFWIEHRLKPQLEMARRKGYYPRISTQKLLAVIPYFFQNYQPLPSLVHGDLWSGNLSFCEGQPVIFDPALYYGDREVDIAMTELFGRLPQAFYQSYNDHFPLDAGYPMRRSLYNLYHILNHYNLFGGIYAFQADALMAKIVNITN